MKTCPRCGGSGDVGVISTLRCTSCSGKGKIRVTTRGDEKRYRDLAIQFGYCECKPLKTCMVCSPTPTDDSLLGDEEADDTWDDGLDDGEVRSLGGDGDGGGGDRDTWPDDGYDDDGWGD
jgi:hypothetical protein